MRRELWVGWFDDNGAKWVVGDAASEVAGLLEDLQKGGLPTIEAATRYVPEDAVWRALLERDVAEVERWLPSWSQSVQATIDARVRKGPGDPTNWEAAGNVLRTRIADCRAWLACAKAVLG